MKNKNKSLRMKITADVSQSLKALSRLEKKLDSVAKKMNEIVIKGKAMTTVLKRVSVLKKIS